MSANTRRKKKDGNVFLTKINNEDDKCATKLEQHDVNWINCKGVG